MLAKMQKAIAIIQFKLEGQMLARRPEWNLTHRRLLHTINTNDKTIMIDGKVCHLKDASFPTINPNDPYTLTEDEQICLEKLKTSFLSSDKLFNHMRYLRDRGSMYLVRDNHLIIHGCVPVDANGEFQSLIIDGIPRKGKELYDTLNDLFSRAIESPTDYDRDMMWYLWCGPQSPLFGKERIATFEIDLVEEHETHAEEKNAFFALMHDADFCDKIMLEFGVDPVPGLIVNGHIPVKIDKGESPIKKSGKAITIDGAFSRVYGDHGFTLILDPEGTFLAKHYHFESVEAAVRDGVDIIPSISEVRRWNPLRKVAQTESGENIRTRIKTLKKLIVAYRKNLLQQGRYS